MGRSPSAPAHRRLPGADWRRPGRTTRGRSSQRSSAQPHVSRNARTGRYHFPEVTEKVAVSGRACGVLWRNEEVVFSVHHIPGISCAEGGRPESPDDRSAARDFLIEFLVRDILGPSVRPLGPGGGRPRLCWHAKPNEFDITAKNQLLSDYGGTNSRVRPGAAAAAADRLTTEISSTVTPTPRGRSARARSRARG